MKVYDALGQELKRGDYMISYHKSTLNMLICLGFKKTKTKVKVLQDYNFISNDPKKMIKISQKQYDDFWDIYGEKYERYASDRKNTIDKMKEIIFTDNIIPEFDSKKSDISWIFHRLYENGKIKSFDKDGFAI